MCEKELLVSYLYDDLGDAERSRFESHLRGCDECRDELNGLRGVRADLISWTPPQPDFGFRVVREPKVLPMPARSWRAWYTPAAGLAAAAVLVLAAAAGLARVEIHRGSDGFTMRTGWSSSAPAVAAAPQPALTNVSASIDPALLAALERRLAALETAPHDAAASPVRNVSLSARASDEEILRRVRDLLAQSETKQQGQLALRISQVLVDVDAQRRADMATIESGLRKIDSRYTEDAVDRTRMANYLLKGSNQK
jgi:anti-sigma factor RsiW